jgi:hypothetical protein
VGRQHRHPVVCCRGVPPQRPRLRRHCVSALTMPSGDHRGRRKETLSSTDLSDAQWNAGPGHIYRLPGAVSTGVRSARLAPFAGAGSSSASRSGFEAFSGCAFSAERSVAMTSPAVVPVRVPAVRIEVHPNAAARVSVRTIAQTRIVDPVPVCCKRDPTTAMPIGWVSIRRSR